MPSNNPAQQPTISSQTILLIGTITYLISITYPLIIIPLSILLSFAIPYAFRVNDDATSRRRLWNEFAKGKDRPQDWKDLEKSVDVTERYWVNSRGMCLSTSLLLPKNNTTPIHAVACFCHGYMDNASFLKRIEYSRYFVKKGIAVVTIEYEGHGRSDGILGLIPDFEKLIDDTSGFFKEVMEEEERFKGKPCFLVGESMGGAIAYHTYHRTPSLYTGIIFSAPMLKISDQMKPPAFITTIFKFLAGPLGTCSFLGYLPITPAKNVQMLSFKLAARRILASSAPMHYGRKPRLATARELVNVAERISEECECVGLDAPFLIVHGREDKVTCPELSQLFYDASRSKDKEIKIYDGMYHTLTSGEPPENLDIVFNDAISWILARA